MEEYFLDNLPSPVALGGSEDIDYLEELGTLFRLFDVVSGPQEEIYAPVEQKFSDRILSTDDNSEEFEENGFTPAPPAMGIKVFEDRDEDNSNDEVLFFPDEPKFNMNNSRKHEIQIPFSGVTDSFVDKLTSNRRFDPDEDDELENDECNSTYEGDDLDELEDDDDEVEGFQRKRVQPPQQAFQVFEVPRGRQVNNNNNNINNYHQPFSQFVPQDFLPQMVMNNNNNNNNMRMRNPMGPPKRNLVNRFHRPRNITELSHQISMREYFSQWQRPLTNVCKIWSPRPLQTYSFDVVHHNEDDGGGGGRRVKSSLGEGMVQDSVITVLSERTDANKHLYVSYNSDFLDEVVFTNGGWDNVRLFGFMREIYLTKERKVIQKFQTYHDNRRSCGNNNNNNCVVPPPPNPNPNINDNSVRGGRRRRRNNNNINNNNNNRQQYHHHQQQRVSYSSKSGMSSPEDQFMIRESDRGCSYVASYQNFLRMNKSIIRTPSERVERVNNGSEYRFEISLDRFNMNLVKVNSSSRLFAKRPFVEFALVLESAKCVLVSIFCFKYHGKETKRGQSKKELRLSTFVFPKDKSVNIDTVFRDFHLGQERLWRDGDDEDDYSFQSSFVSKLDYEKYNDVHGR